jgi:hypothetical protein
VSRAVSDMLSSILASWLVVVPAARNTPRGSTRLPRWWLRASRWLTRLVSWLLGSGARSAKRVGMSSVPPAGRWRCQRQGRCSPSSCRWGWERECGSTPPGRGELSPRWSPKRWRSFCRRAVKGIRAGEPSGRERVRLRPSHEGGTVGRLPHPGPPTAAAPRRGRRGSESER